MRLDVGAWFSRIKCRLSRTRPLLQNIEAEHLVASLESLLASSPFGVAFLDRNLCYVKINDILAGWNGRPAAEHIGRPVRELLPDAEKAEALFQEVLRTGRPLSNFEYEAKPKDALTLQTFWCSFFPLRTASGEVIGVGALFLNITEQKTAERALREQKQRFEMALVAGDIGLWDWNLDSGVMIWNERQYEMTGLPRSIDPMRWEYFVGLMNPDDRERVQNAVAASLKQSSDLAIELRLSRPDGEQRWFQVNGRLAENGTRVVSGTCIDITDRKQSEVMREQFISTLSHDLRTPLTAARMGAQMAGRHCNDPDRVLESSAKVIQNIDRADKMIRDLLDANQIRVGRRLPVHLDTADLSEVVQGTVEELAAVHGNRFHCQSHPGIKGSWDVAALRRVVENLCSNAIKYGSPSRPITVMVEDKDRNAVISVHNWGDPIPRQNRHKLFDYLHRASGAQVSGKSGWGIGLTLVKGVVEAHGGQVEVTSEPGDGTTFTVRLPKQPNAF